MQGAVDRRKTRGDEDDQCRGLWTEGRHQEMRAGRPVQGAVDRRKTRGDEGRTTSAGGWEGRMTSAGGCVQEEDMRR